MKTQFIETGKIVSTHALKGEVKIHPWCDSPDVLLEFDSLFLDNGKTKLTVEKIRVHKNIVIAKFKDIDSIETAQTFRGKTVYLNRQDLELEDDRYFVCDLIGVDVLDIDDNSSYGTICDVQKTGANDVYHIKDKDGKIKLIPAIPSVVIKVDIEQNTIHIKPLEGLFE